MKKLTIECVGRNVPIRLEAMIILLNTPKFYKLEKRELTNSKLCTVSIDVEYKEAQHIEKKEEIDLRSFEGYEMVKSSGFLEIATSKLTENFEMSWNIYLYFIRKEQIPISKKFTIFKATVKQPLKIKTSALQQD